MKLGEHITEYRKRNRLSLRQFADRCGCSHQYINKLENGQIENPSKKLLAQIAQAMDMDLPTMMVLADDYNYTSDFSNISGSPILKRILVKIKDFDDDELNLVETNIDMIIKIRQRKNVPSGEETD